MQKIKLLITRTFKKLTLVDSLLLGVFIVVILGFFIFFKRSTVVIPVTLKVTEENMLTAFSSPKIDYAQSFVVGDTEKNELGQTTATITNVESYAVSPQGRVVFVTVNVAAIYNPRKKQHVVKSKPITYGASLPFTFHNVTFTGVVVNFPTYEPAQKARYGVTRVKAQLRAESRYFSDVAGVPDYLALAVKPSDTILNTNQQVVATIVSVEAVPARRTVVSSSGSLLTTQDPRLFDVFYTVDLATKQINDTFYMFDYFPVRIGETIPLNFSSVSVTPTIVEILQEPSQ